MKINTGTDHIVSSLGRLLVVSNRLPFTATEVEGELQYRGSAGGVASGLSSYFSSKGANTGDYLWIGWPGGTIRKSSNRDKLRRVALDSHQSHPVFLSQDDMENFYQGFCNKIIWPLFHYFPSYAQYKDAYWEQYGRVNRTFCEAVVEAYKPGDTVWVHDYHLMLLPGLLRERLPDAEIGFFLHIPFPAYEIFQLLPGNWRNGILTGLLGADLVGFHTYDYTHNFVRSVLLTLGYGYEHGSIRTPQRSVKADTFPMGIDFEKFSSAAESPEVQTRKSALARAVPGVRIVLSIDRLDYTKGIANRLEAFGTFLEKYAEWRNRVTLALVTVPSRVDVEHYKQTRSRVEELVGRINGTFGRIGWTPVVYQYRSLEFNDLVALYAAADVALVTPLRDGMNLIAKEYLASNVGGTGVLVLSETAGAAQELGEAVVINPNSREEIADALRRALAMEVEERLRRISSMRKRLRHNNLSAWAKSFIEQLHGARQVVERMRTEPLSEPAIAELLDAYRNSAHRLIFLDYDGTLAPYHVDPTAAGPTPHMLYLLEKLSQDPDTDVVIVSGRDRTTLSEWLGALPIGLVAEHGVWIRESPGEWQTPHRPPNQWMESVRPILDLYSSRVPGSFVEEKNFSLALHYRGADPELAAIRVRELVDRLASLGANESLHILPGNLVLEVRTDGVDKGTAARRWLQTRFVAKGSTPNHEPVGREPERAKADKADKAVREDKDDGRGAYPAGSTHFVLAVGDDRTDEDLFRALWDTEATWSVWSIKVGSGEIASGAQYSLHSPGDVLSLLESLALPANRPDRLHRSASSKTAQ
ncbi:MAG: bifunctional alpha,alpha-trehalose-phosphate synthase (UDP-forming)/trehalose-phosphatase [Chloroflexota bacterium]